MYVIAEYVNQTFEEFQKLCRQRNDVDIIQKQFKRKNITLDKVKKYKYCGITGEKCTIKNCVRIVKGLQENRIVTANDQKRVVL